MASNLPLWYGRERGTSLVSLVDFDEAPEADGGLLDKMGNWLFGWINDPIAGVVGFFWPLLVLLMAVAAAAHSSPALAAALALAALCWAVIVGTAAWRIAADGEEAPAWATGLIAILVTFGRTLIVVWIITTIVMVVIAFFCVLIGASMSDG